MLNFRNHCFHSFCLPRAIFTYEYYILRKPRNAFESYFLNYSRLYRSTFFLLENGELVGGGMEKLTDGLTISPPSGISSKISDAGKGGGRGG